MEITGNARFVFLPAFGLWADSDLAQGEQKSYPDHRQHLGRHPGRPSKCGDDQLVLGDCQTRIPHAPMNDSTSLMSECLPFKEVVRGIVNAEKHPDDFLQLVKSEEATHALDGRTEIPVVLDLRGCPRYVTMWQE